MPRRFPSWLLAAMLCVLAQSAWSQAASAAAADDAQAREVRAWLLRIHEAASHRNFQGTFVVTAGGAVSSARIAHFCQGPNQYERSEALDGQARHVYRHNDVVTTLWPATGTAMVEQRNLRSEFPALLQAGDDRIAEFYDVRPGGSERIAGRDANVLEVKPRDAYRYGYRLWADQASGLLLRADVIGAHQEVLESSAFSDVTIGIRPQPESVLRPMRRLDGYRVLRPVLTPTRLSAEGWTLRPVPPGFRQVSCVRRPINGASDDDGVGAHQVLQAIFADGLTYVSLFVEPFDASRHAKPMQASVGPTQTLTQRQGNWWITAVGDVPPATLQLFAKALERSRP
jgi:sigma-E factor negative regulatory protein RseB